VSAKGLLTRFGDLAGNMAESDLTPEVALSIVRGLSGTENYPFHLEGEKRLAGVLVQFTSGVGHARAVVEEFDGDTCPSVESLRTAALRLGEKCRCGFGRWAHPLEKCARFLTVDDGFPQAGAVLETVKQQIPMIPNIPWEVSLRIWCIRLAVSEQRKDPGYFEETARYFPEAVKDVRAGFDPDPEIVLKRMIEKAPWAFKGMTITGSFQSQQSAVSKMRTAREILQQ
jgi:hypothetical protein